MRSAIILVGGFGTRLHPLTLATPKPFLRVGGVPFLNHLILKAKEAGALEIVLASSYKAEIFQEYYGAGNEFGIPIKHAIEEQPLGTGGAIRNALKIVDENAKTVAIFNGDVLSEHDLAKQFLELEKSEEAIASLYLTKVVDARKYGVVTLTSDNFLLEFLEKMENPKSNIINAGCYIFKKVLNEFIVNSYDDNQVVSVEREIFPSLLSTDKKILGYLDESYWLDMGTPETLVKASADLIQGKVSSPAFKKTSGSALIGQNCQIATAAKIFGGSDIQDEVIIEEGVIIESSIIGKGAQIAAGAQIINSVVNFGVRVPKSMILINNFYGF